MAKTPPRSSAPPTPTCIGPRKKAAGWNRQMRPPRPGRSPFGKRLLQPLEGTAQPGLFKTKACSADELATERKRGATNEHEWTRMDTNEDKLLVPIRARSWQSSAPISRIIFGALFKPLIQMLGNECVVVLLGVCVADAIKLSRLAGGQAFLWIERRDILQKPLQ